MLAPFPQHFHLLNHMDQRSLYKRTFLNFENVLYWAMCDYWALEMWPLTERLLLFYLSLINLDRLKFKSVRTESHLADLVMLYLKWFAPLPISSQILLQKQEI